MRRRWSLLAVGAAVLVVAGVVGGSLLSGREVEEHHAAAGVPLFSVEPGRLTRTVSTEGFLVAVQATPITVPVDAPGMLRILSIARDGQTVEEGEVVIRFDPTDLERELADGKADFEIAELKIERSRRENGTQQENLLVDATVAEQELAQAQQFASLDPTVFSRHDILDSEIDRELAEERASNALSRSRTVQDQGRTDLELLAIEKSKAEMKIRRAEKGLASLEVRAPHAGMLVLRRNWRGERPRFGDQVWPGQKLAEIPDPQRMQARAYVLEADAAGLEAGQAVDLVVEAHPERSYPGTVDRVDALAKKRHHNIPVQYFEAILIPDETDVETMRPGQRVRGEIVLEEIDDALAVPPQAVFQIDDKATVFRQEGSRLVSIHVTLGPRSLSRVQILDGLEPGDEVALRDPRQSARESLGEAPKGAAGPSTPVGGMP